MYAGRIMEVGSVAEVFATPAHAYTLGLLRSLPGTQPARQRLEAIAGTPPDPSALPPGCRFAPRCGLVTTACQAASPPLVAFGPDWQSACLRASDVHATLVEA